MTREEMDEYVSAIVEWRLNNRLPIPVVIVEGFDFFDGEFHVRKNARIGGQIEPAGSTPRATPRHGRF